MIQSGKLKLREHTVKSAYGDIVVVSLEGTVTLGKESVLLRDTLRERCDTVSSRILLDLEDVTFMDSSGIGVLVELKAHALHHMGDVRVCNCPSFVTRILFRLALHRILEVYETEDQALHAWGVPIS